MKIQISNFFQTKEQGRGPGGGEGGLALLPVLRDAGCWSRPPFTSPAFPSSGRLWA